MGKEIELKYSLSSAQQVDEILNHPFITDALCTAPITINMDSVYYDTAESALAHSGISLRRRKENDTTVFTVKTSEKCQGAFSSRGEWQVTASELQSALALLRQEGAPEKLFDILEKQDIMPCARTVFARQTAPLKLGAELCLDVGLLGNTPFAELELELTDGSVDQLTEFGARCAELFGLTAEPRSKFHRARLSFSNKGE